MNRAHASKTKTHIEGTGKHVQDGRRRRCATLRGGPSAKQSTRFGTAADTDQMSERVRRRMCIHTRMYACVCFTPQSSHCRKYNRDRTGPKSYLQVEKQKKLI